MRGKRWTVERERDVFESIIADEMLLENGTLVFGNGQYGDDTVILIAAGQWITAFPDDDGAAS